MDVSNTRGTSSESYFNKNLYFTLHDLKIVIVTGAR